MGTKNSDGRNRTVTGCAGHCPTECCADSERRAISRVTASLIVAIPGAVLLGIGMVLLNMMPYPGELLGEGPVVVYYCGLTATTTGSAALAAAVFLSASRIVSLGEAHSRDARYALGIALIAALAALA
jgi:hypothetical protein